MFIEERLGIGEKEAQSGTPGGLLLDFIDLMITRRKEAETEKICIICGAANDVSYTRVDK